MKLRCINNANTLPNEPLTLDRIYDIDPRRDVELNFQLVPAHYFLNGKRYGAWRFVPVAEDAAKAPNVGDSTWPPACSQ